MGASVCACVSVSVSVAVCLRVRAFVTRGRFCSLACVHHVRARIAHMCAANTLREIRSSPSAALCCKRPSQLELKDVEMIPRRLPSEMRAAGVEMRSLTKPEVRLACT